jgi:tetratricopeptide (TPR) repeat protein
MQKTFESGLAYYEAGEFSLALIDWHRLLQDPKYSRSEEVLYNLALTEFKLQEYGPALAHLRKALVLNPMSLKTHKTIKLIKKAIESKDYYRVASESYFKTLLNWLPKTNFIILFVLCLGLGTYNALSQSSEGVRARTYFKPYFYFLILSLLPLSLLFIQTNIQSETYATLTGDKPITLYTSNSFKAPEIGTLKAGDAFQVLKVSNKGKKGWIAVTTSNSPFGWIKTGSYIVYRGKIDPKDSRN